VQTLFRSGPDVAESPAKYAPAHTLRTGERLRLYLELTKARLSAMVLLSTLVAFLVAGRGHLELARLVWTLLGTGLCALSANALNEWWEVDRDALMLRTRSRPLPAGRMSRAHALGVGIGLGIIGQLTLLTLVGALAALLALASLLLYVLVYTPLKPRSPVNTLVGAVCGALPPLVGWAGAAGELGRGAWLLAALLFLWQIPHFLALAWLYREDYARAGFRMLPGVDPSGRLTGALVVVYSLALLPVGLALTLAGVAGSRFAVGYLLLGLLLLVPGLRLRRRLDEPSARRLFVASMIHLPLVLALLLADPAPRVPDTTAPTPPAPTQAEGAP